jgi:hypothetical protein
MDITAPIKAAQNLDRLVKMLACLLAGVKRPAFILGRRRRSGFQLANGAGKATLSYVESTKLDKSPARSGISIVTVFQRISRSTSK